MKPKRIANRLTGFSTPFFGLQWTPAVLDSEVAAKLVRFLKDRDVLWAPYSAEVPEHVVKSIEKIRDRLTSDLDRDGLAPECIEMFEAMRAACRQFMREVERGETELIVATPNDAWAGGPQVWFFNQALGRFRGTFGMHLAVLAVAYNLEIPEPLSECLPPDPHEDSHGGPRT